MYWENLQPVHSREGQVLGPDLKARMLLQTLPENVQAEISLAQEGAKWTSESIFGYLKRRCGQNESFEARRTWERVRHERARKVTQDDFLKFYTAFVLARRNVGDETEFEAYRLFRQKLPGELQKWCTEEEAKKSERRHILVLGVW